jgi:hypothetical protein
MLTSPLFVLFLPAHAVFEIAGLELWMLPMYAAMDSTGMGSQPRRNTNPAASLYFVVFILFGSFLVMNLFVGAVVDNFNRQSDKSGEVKEERAAPKLQKMGQSKPGATETQENLEMRAVAEVLGGDGKRKSAAKFGQLESGEPGKASLATPGQTAFMESVNLVFSRKPITRPAAPKR